MSFRRLRKNIGVVLQDVFLFSGSVIDNITLRKPVIPKEKVIEASKLIEMHNFIMHLPGNYNYNVMERGATLIIWSAAIIIIHPCHFIQSLPFSF